MGTPKQPQDTRKRDEESRRDRADLAEADGTTPPADGPAERDESGKTAGPREETGASPRPNHHQKADRTDTSDE